MTLDPRFSPSLYWPLPLVGWADHCARDWARFWSQVATLGDPPDLAPEEGALGLNLLHESLAAWTESALIPLRARSSISHHRGAFGAAGDDFVRTKVGMQTQAGGLRRSES